MFELKKYKDNLLFVPLGGSSEIGMNLNLYYFKGKWLMIDLGIGFADDYLPGIDIILPDISFLHDIADDLLGLVLTHAHEDHLGAVPYLWNEIKCEVFATAFTVSVLKAKLKGEGLLGAVPITEIGIGSSLDIGPFNLDLIPLTHSIPEMQALAIKTSEGTVIHTGDWKLDPSPVVGLTSDEEALKKYGDAGVLAMVCDSTNVFVEGDSGSENVVKENLKTVVNDCKQLVVVSTFASNIARVESIIRAAEHAGRRVVLAGRSLHRVTDAAKDSGYLLDVADFISEKQAAKLPKHEVLVLCTGCQGEARAALSRMVSGSHPHLKLSKGDTVLLSSRIIPGNETRIRWMTNQMIKLGLEIVTGNDADIHVSGHPARDELKRMYEMVRPQIAVPVHGEAAHINEHAAFAKSMQVPEIVESFNGAVINLSKGNAEVVGKVHSGYLAVDGTTIIPVDSHVIRMRRKLQEAGNITISVVLDADGDVVSDPQISAIGSLDSKEDTVIIEQLQNSITKAIYEMSNKKKQVAIKDKIRSVVRKTINYEIGKKPVLEVHIHYV